MFSHTHVVSSHASRKPALGNLSPSCLLGRCCKFLVLFLFECMQMLPTGDASRRPVSRALRRLPPCPAAACSGRGRRLPRSRRAVAPRCGPHLVTRGRSWPTQLPGSRKLPRHARSTSGQRMMRAIASPSVSLTIKSAAFQAQGRTGNAPCSLG
jgi:hypothetical protein